jgi:hypothetical protein
MHTQDQKKILETIAAETSPQGFQDFLQDGAALAAAGITDQTLVEDYAIEWTPEAADYCDLGSKHHY